MKRINLNFDWRFTPEFKEDYISPSFNDGEFDSVNIPHTVKEIPYNNFDEESYQFISCYRKSFTIDKVESDKAYILEFEAVSSYAEVYINGEFAFAHKGGFTSFNGDIKNLIKEGENIIAVKVDSTERADIPPFGNVIDYLCYGGIYREVYLYVKPENHIVRFLAAGKDLLSNPKMELKIEYSALPIGDTTGSIKDNDGNAIAKFNIAPDTLKNKVTVEVPLKSPVLWEVNNPYLYTLELNYNGETYSDRIGFRDVKFTKKGFFLNGKPTKILGLNRHQSFPYVGYAMPASAQIDDADYLKELGLNLARTSHYPNSKHFLNRCDEIGLMVFTEIPGWQHIGKSEEWRQVCLQHVKEMIEEDYNHPSIVLWGVRINESGDDNDLYSKTNALAHSLDSSRQTSGVRCIPQSSLLEDVYSYNDFSHTGNNAGLMPKIIVCGNKPLLISEHNGHMFPTKTFDHEKKRQEHAIRHATVINRAFERKNTCGAIGWCMSDYNTHKDFGSGDKICYHGVSDMFRIDKLAASVYRSQQDDYPVLKVTSNMEIGDTAGGQVGTVYMITNCDRIKLFKNGKEINEFDVKALAEKSKFKALPHPPLVLEDIIGNQIKEDNQYNLSDRAERKLKKLLLDIRKHGTIPAVVRNIFSVAGLIIRYKLGVESITDMFGKYATTWGDKSVTYRFEGYKGDQVVVDEKASVSRVNFSVKADRDTLIEKDTYDVVRIAVKAENQCGNVLPYANDVFKISVDGAGALIGEDTVALLGGQRAFWIKTKGESGDITVTVNSRFGENKLTLKAIKTEI